MLSVKFKTYISSCIVFIVPFLVPLTRPALVAHLDIEDFDLHFSSFSFLKDTMQMNPFTYVLLFQATSGHLHF